ncbi:hypothetical protein EVAR_90825_1 [Eumeta japonica]|uniref:RNA-directed DNA polymerase from mobile element jockey n=1 Tax=Eumeta variegata TaxID=151549 RepID=A0A4C1SB87_EUMVA|nr:hypothetical protein EVAR_90825_1 [Eumeta japonica]
MPQRSSGNSGRAPGGTVRTHAIGHTEAASHHVQVERRVEEFLMAPVPPLPGDYFAIQRHTRDRTLSEELEDGPCHRHTESRQDPDSQRANDQSRCCPTSPSCSRRIALRRLLRHLTPRQEQFGFRSGTPLRSSWQESSPRRRAGSSYRRVFLDIERRSTECGTRLKLLNTQIPPALVRTVASFLEGRSFFVAVEDATSDPTPGAARQLSVSVPVRSLRTISPLQVNWDWEEDVVLALYADDSAYFASSRRADLAAAKIQRVLDLLPKAGQMASRRKRYRRPPY